MTLHRLPVALTALALAVAAGCGDDEKTEKSSTESAPRGGGTLFVQTTSSGRLEPSGEGSYELTLAKPSQAVTSFSDRPARVSGQESLETFVGDWDKRGFASDPPNAALVTEDGAKQSTVVLELTEPKLARGALTYKAKRVEGAATGSLAGVAKGSSSVPERFGTGQLFIDDAAEKMVPIPLDVTVKADRTENVKVTLDQPAVMDFDQESFTFSIGGPATGGAGEGSVEVAGSGQYQVPCVMPISALSSPITGTASLDSGATATVSVNGGKQQPLKNGRFSFATGLGN